MERDSEVDKGDEGIETNADAKTSRRKSSGHGLRSSRLSTVDGMSAIPETEEVSFQHSNNAVQGVASLLRHEESVVEPSSPSILRRLTNRLKSPMTPTHTSRPPIPSPIPMAVLGSLKRSRGTGYENLQDIDEDQSDVPVDLSWISGLGFQLAEAGQSHDSSWLNQDTTYQSPSVENTGNKPDFQSFVRRRQVGDGLVVGAELRRDSSVSQANHPDAKIDEIKRSKTVRNAAQNIAQSRNMIVAVSESVDLSFFEGPMMRHQTSQTFDTMVNRTGTVDNLQQSYFFPPDPDVPSWRPMTMSTPYITFLTIGAFALAASQEYLCQTSQIREGENGGILDFDDIADVSVGVFFVWKYLPTMVTIIYAVCFSVMDFDIRRLEPFYQLSQPQGSPASESLNVDHLTMFQYFVPFKAFRLGQWTVFFSTIGNIIASTASPALQNPSVDFRVNQICREVPDGNGTRIECPKDVKKFVVLITPIWSRLLSCSYLVIGIIAVILFFQLRRKTGLLSDPKGIAGIASMATKSHILRDFKGTDTATRQDIQKRLAHRRFVLYKSSIWQGQWNLDNEPEQESARSLSSPHPPMLRIGVAIPFITAQIFCLVAVPVISLTRANAVPNAVPWLPILVATILKLVWSTFEADVRLMEPFYQLSRGNASPESSLTLDYQSTIYGLLPFKAAYNGHWLLCIVGLCSVALDVLSVTVSSFSIQADMFYSKMDLGGAPAPHDNNGEGTGSETKVSFWTSVTLSMVILTFVILTTLLVYLRRRHPFLPREPSTIASVLAFIYASNMLEDFIDTEKMTNKQMEKKLKATKKKYALGWFRGRDGELHCAIDQEPVRSKYVHGKRYDQALAGPMDGYYA